MINQHANNVVVSTVQNELPNLPLVQPPSSVQQFDVLVFDTTSNSAKEEDLPMKNLQKLVLSPDKLLNWELLSTIGDAI